MPDRSLMLFDFSEASAHAGWRSVDDVVMGGVSDSRLATASPDTVAFEGHVSLDHGGGFASIRAPDGPHDLSAFDGLLIRARGDGNRYKLTVYTGASSRVSYRFPFVADDEWTEYFASFDALTPMIRGRHASDAPPFVPSAITTLGFLIGDKQAGSFQLELRWIKAVSEP